MAVALAKRSTPHRIARARSRASGRRALTAAMRTPSPRKFATSQPTSRISAAPMTRGTHEKTNSVRRPVPGMASASMATGKKSTRTLQKTTSPSTCEGGLRTPARFSAATMPHASARRSKATACASRRATRALTHAPASPTAASVSIARIPGSTSISLVLRSARAAHTRSPHISVMIRASRRARSTPTGRSHGTTRATRQKGATGGSALPGFSGNVYRRPARVATNASVAGAPRCVRFRALSRAVLVLRSLAQAIAV